MLTAKNTKAEFANGIDPDEKAHNELPHLALPVCHLVFQFL